MSATSDHLAVVFDFDDTLVPDSTSLFLSSKGVDIDDFWGRRAKELLDNGYDSPMAYLQLMIDEARRDGALEGLTLRELTEFGATLDDKYFDGLPEFFDDVREIVKAHRDITIEFYIISSGIGSLIEGSKVVQEHIDAVYACQLAEHPETGVVSRIKRAVTFTEKTRYLFEINKGIPSEESYANPGLVNKKIEDRRIPMTNMIYVGDGLTDIPCFSLVKNGGGYAFGVFDPDKPSTAKRALEEFLNAGRTTSTHFPRYGEDHELGQLIRTAVLSKCSQIGLSRQQAG